MMLLAKLGNRIAELKRSQKEVAGDVHTWLERNAENDTAQPTTIDTKLSKLLSGSSEGHRFFRDSRREGLAHALDVPAAQVAEWLDGEAILLDPALSPEIVAGLRDQVTKNSNVELVEVTLTPDVSKREALRRAADDREDAIIGLASPDDLAFYEGRKRRASVIEWTPRGWTLRQFPNLIHLPPPTAPEMWSRKDRPLVSHPALDAAVERGDGRDLTSLQHRRYQCVQRGQVPSYELEHAKRWIEEQCGFSFELATNFGHPISLSIEEVMGKARKNRMWIFDERIHVLGPNASQLAPWLVPHDVQDANAIVETFHEALKTKNPFVDISADGHCIDFKQALEQHRKEVTDATWRPDHPVDVLGFDQAAEVRARTVLRELAERPWSVPRRDASIVFWLQRAAVAPVRLLAPGAFFDLHVIASMGGGRVLRIQLARFPGTRPTAIQATRKDVLDGGDVRVWLNSTYDEMLEGEPSATTARRRRREDDGISEDDD